MVNDLVKRTKSIKVYLFEEEKTTIEEKAIATGVTASEYLRSCGLRRVLMAKPSADLITIRATAIVINLLAAVQVIAMVIPIVTPKHLLVIH